MTENISPAIRRRHARCQRLLRRGRRRCSRRAIIGPNFEPLQLALASSDRLVRILRPIIFPTPLLMPTGKSQTPERGGVGAQLVGDQQFPHEALLLEGATTKLPRPRTGS